MDIRRNWRNARATGATHRGAMRGIAAAVMITALLAVQPAAAQQAQIGAPAHAAPGADFEIDWTGPDDPGDFIALAVPTAPAAEFLAYARTSGGNPASMTAPDAGEYEIRYVSTAGLAILARSALRVGETVAGKLSAPSEVRAGANVIVTVADPGEPADYVTIVEAGAPDDALGSYARLRGAPEVAVAAPQAPGSFEIRQIRASSQTVLARAPLSVIAPQPVETAPVTEAMRTETHAEPPTTQALRRNGASLMALVAVDAGRVFHVAWTGPGREGDSIEIRADGGAAAIASRPADAGTPLRFTAPEAAGGYRIVYAAGADGALLAERALEVR